MNSKNPTYEHENRLTSVTATGLSATFTYDGDGNRVKVAVGSTTTVYIGNHYEKNTSTGVITKYYYAGGQRVAMRAGSTLYYLFSDHLGSSSVSLRASDQYTVIQRYYPWGTIRPGPDNSLPTDYAFTGQKLDTSTGLMYYVARYYDPVLGRFVQADTIVPNPGNPQSLNRYAYANNSPLTYIDSGGHFAFVPLLVIGGIVLPKAIDYGWTAWDSYQSLKVINDPNASEAAKQAATANLAMTAAFEMAEPDDFLPIALPIDDLIRKGILKWGREGAEEVAEQGFKSFTYNNLRENLRRLTGKSADEIASLEAHHVLPQEMAYAFEKLGLNIYDPRFGSWVDAAWHRQFSHEYNARWKEFLSQQRSLDDILRYAKQLAEEYGFDVNFDNP